MTKARTTRRSSLHGGLVGVLLLAAWAQAGAVEGAGLVSGQRIPAGGGRGPLSAGLSNQAAGMASVSKGAFPDIFVATRKFSSDPGLFLYRWAATAADGSPVFGERQRVALPDDEKTPGEGVIFESKSGTIYGFWLDKGSLVRTTFDAKAMAFVRLPGKVELKGLPRAPEAMGVIENTDGSLELIFSVSDGTSFKPAEPPTHREPGYRPFDGAGIWTGGWPYVTFYGGMLTGPEDRELKGVRRIAATDREVRLSCGSIAGVRLAADRPMEFIAGARFGIFSYYGRTKDGVGFEPQRLVQGPERRVMRHPTITSTPMAYPNAAKLPADLIVGGEGGLYFYRFTAFDAQGVPVYGKPVQVLQDKTELYLGTLPVVNAADWDGDGMQDLIAGNSQGEILFCKNTGSNEKPDFAMGQMLAAGGETIRIQQGYWGVQGPGEARWGYVSPTVVDWNEDGLLDIVMSDATARHTVYLNIGSKTEPKLSAPRLLYCEGIELCGTWRVRPAAAKLGKEMAYVTLDEQDQFHLYWKIDDLNLRDGGKLTLEDGSPIGANFIFAGGTGRSKIVLFDWDRDGKTDLLVGTPRHGSVPNPKTGLPQSKGLPGSAVLFLKNTGSNEKPVFQFPQILNFQGKPRYFGQHEMSVVPVDFGGPGGPHLIVGSEEGRVYFLNRADITWSP